MTDQNIAAIIVAAGSGSRSGLSIPKQYARLGGQPVLGHSHAALASHPHIDRIVVVIGAGQDEMARKALSPLDSDTIFVTGGETRRASVLAGLECLEAPRPPDHVLVHDAARPVLPSSVIDRLIAALATVPGVVPVLPVADTLTKAAGDVMGADVAREGLYRVQTPQAFRYDAILRAYRTVPGDAPVTDDAGLLRALGMPVHMVEGDSMLEKLTYSGDFDRAEALLATRRMPRVGSGFDVHRLVRGKPLWLCGIEVAHSHGLSGHSDADVAIHALVDAILGALGEGDIGSHFPPSDPQWKGASSHHFLDFARDRVAARGGEITHADVTIICEAPKIGPHRDAMRMRLAELMRVSPNRVSIKATTTERLGMTGRGEGIAAQAVATLMLPDL